MRFWITVLGGRDGQVLGFCGRREHGAISGYRVVCFGGALWIKTL